MISVLLVHGIVDDADDRVRMLDEWTESLVRGAAMAGQSALVAELERRNVEVRMCYYGDIVRPEVVGLTAGQQATPLVRELLDDLGRAIEEEEEEEEEEDDEVSGYASRWRSRSMIRQAIRTLAQVDWLAARGFSVLEQYVMTALGQVSAYLTDQPVRDEVMARLDRQLLDGPDIVIAHSLGSIVAYEALHRAEGRFERFVTMGSPLGLPTIIDGRLQPREPTYPSTVARWVNVADPADIVAFETDLRGYRTGMRSDQSFESGMTVRNGSSPHAASAYLQQPAVVAAIAELLERRV